SPSPSSPWACCRWGRLGRCASSDPTPPRRWPAARRPAARWPSPSPNRGRSRSPGRAPVTSLNPHHAACIRARAREAPRPCRNPHGPHSPHARRGARARIRAGAPACQPTPQARPAQGAAQPACAGRRRPRSAHRPRTRSRTAGPLTGLPSPRLPSDKESPVFTHNKRLQYTVRVNDPNPALANLLLEQFGGPQGELAAAMRYFTQGIAEDDPGRKDMLIDIATEELSHLEVIGSLVAMLNKGAKGRLAEAGEEEGELLRSLQGAGNDSHLTQGLDGGGPARSRSGGQPWTAGYIDSIGEPTADLRSNIAAEARAKIVYERLINVTADPGVRDALTFLMTREMAHLKSFEKALHAIEPNFPPGKLPGMPEFQ